VSADPDWTQPPPNNAGIRPHQAVPKKKSVEFANLTVSYDYEQGLVTVKSAGQEFSFDKTELAEFDAALAAFGLPISDFPGGVTYR
jgi:hypothetical protein